MRIGLLLPHFGNQCTWERVFGHVQHIEDAGVSTVWVRDHLSFRPHGFEEPQTLFLEPFTTLSAIAARTKKLFVGTSVITTFRHPLVTSQLFGTLYYIAQGRMIAGVGAGGVRPSFDAVGISYEKRARIIEEMIEILRLTWRQDHVSYHGEIYHFDDMTIDPRPAPDTPIYYGGMSYTAMRRAARLADGWLPQRIPFKTLDGMVAQMRELEAKLGKKKPTAVINFPLVSIDRDSRRARERIGLKKILEFLAQNIAEKKWKGVSATEEDVQGSVVMGSPQECVDQLGEFQRRGYEEVVLDMRNTFDEWESAIELLGTYVVPHFK